MNVIKSLLSLVSGGYPLAKSNFDIILACPAFPSISSREGNQILGNGVMELRAR